MRSSEIGRSIYMHTRQHQPVQTRLRRERERERRVCEPVCVHVGQYTILSMCLCLCESLCVCVCEREVYIRFSYAHVDAYTHTSIGTPSYLGILVAY